MYRMAGSVLAVNVADVRLIPRRGGQVATGIWKQPVEGRVAMRGVKMGDPLFVKRFAKALRPGTYLRIVKEGDVAAGDVARVVDRPGHGVSVSDVARAYLNGGDGVERLLDVPELTNGWRAWATSRLRRPSPRSARA
jgi:MOSC domain-containing protein YiiM